MTVLITGAAGYVGSATAHHLSRYHDKPKMIGVDNLTAPGTCPLPADFDCLHGDVGHEAFMANVIDRYRVKHIVHCAAKIVVPESVAEPYEYYANNTAATLALLKVALRKNVRGVVFSSTAAVYGDADMRDRPLHEDDACHPCSPYGQSKLMVEQFLHDAWHAYTFSSVSLRYFNVAGADPMLQTGPHTEGATHLITRAVRAALGRIPKLLVYGDGIDKRDYVHVSDVAEANALSLEWLGRNAGQIVCNIGTGIGTSAMDILAKLRDMGVVFNWDYARRREGDPASVVANIAAAQKHLNWAPRHDLQSILETAIQWEKMNAQGRRAASASV